MDTKTFKHVSERGTLELTERDVQILVNTESADTLRRDGRIEMQLLRGNVAPRDRNRWILEAAADIDRDPAAYEVIA